AHRRATDARLGRTRFVASSLWFHDEEREFRTRPNPKPSPQPGVERRLRADRAARELRWTGRREMRGGNILPVVRTSGSWRPARVGASVSTSAHAHAQDRRWATVAGGHAESSVARRRKRTN